MVIRLSSNIADILQKVNLKIPETVEIQETPYAGTPLEPIGASDPKVKEIVTEIQAKQILESADPTPPMASSVVELQQTLTPTKKETAQSVDNSNGNGSGGEENIVNTVIEGGLAAATPGLYLIDQLKDILKDFFHFQEF